MASNNIGNAALVLSTDGGKLSSGLEKTAADIKAWAGRVGGIVQTAFKGTVGAVVGTIASAITHPFDKLKELSAVTKQADVLGIAPSELAGLQKQLAVVGIDADKVGTVFALMGKNITAAAKGATDVIEDLDGGLTQIDGKGKAKVFANLGISLDQLKGQNYADQFRTIADAIGRLPKGAEQASAAMAVFGKSGAGLLPVLQKGSAGINEFIEQQKKFGTVLSDDQYRAAAEAQKAWQGAKKSIGAAWEGLSNRATLVAAPVIEFIGKGMSQALQFLTPVFAALGEGLETASVILSKIGEEATKFVTELIDGIKAVIKESGVFGTEMVSAADVVKGAFLAVGTGIAGVFDIVKGVVAQFKLMVADVVEMKLQIEATLAVIQNEGIQQANEKLRQHQAETEKLKRDRAEAFEFKNAKQFQDWFLKQDFQRPKAKPNPENAVRNDKPKDFDFSKIKQVAAMLEGSKEAYDQEAQFATRRMLGGWDAQQKVEQQQLEQLKRINLILDKVDDRLGGGVALLAG